MRIRKFLLPLVFSSLLLSSCVIKSNSSSGTSSFNNNITQTTSSTVYPTSISISGGNSLYVGETLQLSVSFTPSNTTEKNVTWTSSSTSVASVSSKGLVEGKASGYTTITAQAKKKDGSYAKATLTITVKSQSTQGTDIYPTSITLSGSSSVEVGSYIDLTVNYTPSNTNVKNVTWTSSNSSIASVSTSGRVTGVKAGSATITARALKSNGSYATASKTITVTSSSTVQDDYTILIYMCGADLESNNGCASDDISEILSVNIPSNINIAIETGGASSWQNYGIRSDKLGRYHVNGTSLVNDTYLTNASMGEASTFQSFLTWGLTNYPAKQTGVILWNHGGAMAGCCSDENYDDTLSPSELHSACGNALQSVNKSKLDWIGYDCCLMSVADIASLNADYFNYMVTSQESEWGDGWAYDEWLPTLKNNPSIGPVNLLSTICDTFVGYYDYWGSSNNNQTLAVLDLTTMGSFITAFDNYANALNITSTSAFDKATTARNNSLQFGYIENYQAYPYGIADFSSWLVEMNKQFPSASQTALKNALKNLVVHNTYGGYYTSGTGYPCGVCALITGVWYCPADGYTYYWGLASSYSASCTNFTVWQQINASYSNGLYWN